MSRDDVDVPENFGVDLGGQFSIREAVEWAVENGVRNIDVRLTDRIGPDEYEEEETERIRSVAERHEISLGLHTLSAMNTAEFTPILADSAEEYLFSFVDVAALVDADRVIVHAGYHFTADRDERREASLEMLRSARERASERDVTLLLENMNPEPDDAEVHYLCSELSDVERYFDELASPNLHTAFNPPHAHLHDEGISGYLDALDVDRFREVRLNDNRGVREEHLMPGEGTIDFEYLFDRLDGMGYQGPYTVALGSIEDSLEGIRRFEEMM